MSVQSSDRLLDDGGATAGNHEDGKRLGIEGAKGFEDGLGGADGLGGGRGMASAEIAEASDLIRGFDGGGDDAFESATHLGFEGGGHGVGRLSDRDDEETMIRIEIVKVLSDAKHAAMAVNVAGEGAVDGRVSEGGGENVAGGLAHAGEFGLAGGSPIRHGRFEVLLKFGSLLGGHSEGSASCRELRIARRARDDKFSFSNYNSP
jgi:hypothetical protein